MTARGVNFLETWIAKNVTAADQGQKRATILATACIIKASTHGILLVHMADDVKALERVIMEAAEQLAKPGTPGD